MIRRPLSSVSLEQSDIDRMKACLQKKLSEPDGWENAAEKNEQCPRCFHGRAYFMQHQPQSADEPATTFYRCANDECDHRWKD